MVRTYDTHHATISQIGQLFDHHYNSNVDKHRYQQPHHFSNSAGTIRPSSSSFYLADNIDHNASRRAFGAQRSGSVPLFRLTPRPSEPPLFNNNKQETRRPIILPFEEARIVEPVYGGNFFGENNFERQLREQDRQQKQSYLKDLQQQAIAQRDQRIRKEIEYGGYEFQKDVLLQQQQNRRSSFSNPSTTIPIQQQQPQFSTNRQMEYQNNNYNANTSDIFNNAASGDYEKYLKASDRQHRLEYAQSLLKQAAEQQTLRQSSTDLQFRPSHVVGGRGYTPTFGAAVTAPLGRREQSVPSNLNLIAAYDPLAMDFSRRQQKPREPEIYDPWGKGGAGAPIRDKTGKVMADRRYLQKSWNEILDTNVPHTNDALGSSQSASFFGTAPEYNTYQGTVAAGAGTVAPATEKDYYKAELRKQIEEQQKARELQKQLDREQDERDRLRIERDLEKQRREAEEERKKQEEKAARVQMRAKQASIDIPDPQLQHAVSNKKMANNGSAGEKKPPLDDGLEWWERQPQRGRNGSAPTRISANHSRDGSGAHRVRTPSADGYRSNGSPMAAVVPNGHISPNSLPQNHHQANANNHHDPASHHQNHPANHHEDPEDPTAKNAAIMRQLSAMRERLNREQIRVKSAMRRRGDNDSLSFDNDRGQIQLQPTNDVNDHGSYNHNHYPSRGESRDHYGQQPRQHYAQQPHQHQAQYHASSSPSPYNNDHQHRQNPYQQSQYHQKPPMYGGRPPSIDPVPPTSQFELDDDPPLVKLIKNSRTFDPASLTRPPPSPIQVPMPKSQSLLHNDYQRASNGRRYDYGDEDSGPDTEGPDAVVNHFLKHRSTTGNNKYY